MWHVGVAVVLVALAAGVVIGVLMMGRNSTSAEDISRGIVQASAAEEEAEYERAVALVRFAIPAAEAYGIDRGDFAGMTSAALKSIDPEISHIVVGASSERSYCLQAISQSGVAVHFNGPMHSMAAIESGDCFS
jgi:hypothetical protein